MYTETDRDYFLARHRKAREMAEKARDRASRLAHEELAQLYAEQARIASQGIASQAA